MQSTFIFSSFHRKKTSLKLLQGSKTVIAKRRSGIIDVLGDADSLASRDNIGGKDIKTEEKEKKGVEREDTGKQHERS